MYQTACCFACVLSNHPDGSTTSSSARPTASRSSKQVKRTIVAATCSSQFPMSLIKLLWKLDFESDPPRLLVNKAAQA